MRKSGLKKAIVLGLTVAMALGTMVTGNAAGKTWKYSFNTDYAGSAWTNAYSQVYDDAKGYGFDEANGWSAGVTVGPVDSAKIEGAKVGVEFKDEDTSSALARGVSAVKGDTEVKFYAKLPAGTYKVTVYAGGLSQNNTYDFNKIYVNGEEIVRSYETDPWNSETKSSHSKLLTVDNMAWVKTITLDKETKVEIKASNPAVTNVKYFGADAASAGGRAYMNGVVIEEVKADSNVPKTGVVSTAAICGLVALAGAGVAVVSRKKED